MYDYDDYEDYYEPGLADNIFAEYKEKLVNALNESIKNEINQFKEANTKLVIENDAYKLREQEISRKERELKYKEENLKREVENEFYQSNIGETLKQYIENSELWFADSQSYQKEKCNLCNDERELIAIFPNGKQSKVQCECAKFLSRCIPALTEMDLIKFSKRDSNYHSERRFYLSRSYSPSKNSNYDDSYNEFTITYIIDKFNEDAKLTHKDKRYNEKLGFKTKVECQKYCDWLNKKKSK